ncbi:MAG: hypothetical protein LC667_07030, partial [Thioalkalivibrio sp.]|nr:hypothetical protein [Thioalkalivibrio sp.]
MSVRAATKWVEENSDEVSSWGQMLLETTIAIGRWAVGALGWFVKFGKGLQLIAVDLLVFDAKMDAWVARLDRALSQGFAGAIQKIAAFAAHLARLPGPLQALLGLGGALTAEMSRWADGMAEGATRRLRDAEAHLGRVREAAAELRDEIVGVAAAAGTPDETPATLPARRTPSDAGGDEEEKDGKKSTRDALGEEIGLLKQGADLRILTAAEIARIGALESQIRARLEQGNLSLKDRVELHGRLKELEALRQAEAVREREGLKEELDLIGRA